MMQDIFDRIAKHRLADWAVVLQGVRGVPGNSDRLPHSCVKSFANSELDNVALDDPSLDVIVRLADDSDLPASELIAEIQKICDSKIFDIQQTKRIWRAAALEDVMANLDSDPIYGLITLSDFWSSWGWPDDAPPSMVPGAKQLPEYDYHSISNYEHVMREHAQWLDDELGVLK